MLSVSTLNSKGVSPFGKGITVAAGSNTIYGCFFEIDIVYDDIVYDKCLRTRVCDIYESKFTIDVIKYKVIQNIGLSRHTIFCKIKS